MHHQKNWLQVIGIFVACLWKCQVAVSQEVQNKIPVRWEKEVIDDILTNYSTSYRPVENNRQALQVYFDLQLRKLVRIEIKDQVFAATVFITLEWLDPQLRWDEAKFNQTSSVNLEPGSIWTPDIVLYNTADDEARAHTDLYKTRVRIRSDGTVTWLGSVLLKSSCSISILWFPFDSQSCSLTFGSWSYPAEQLQLGFKSRPGGKDDIRKGGFLVTSGEWSFNSLSVTNEDKVFTCCPKAFSTVSFTFMLSRKPLYYLLYLILPCISLSSLSVLTFMIPHAAGERIGFGVTMLLNMSVYLLVISDRLPEKSDASPLIGILYVVYFYVMSLGLVAAVGTSYFAHKTTPPPPWIRKRFLSNKTPKENMVKPLVTYEGEVVSMDAIPSKTEPDGPQTNSATLRQRKASRPRRHSNESEMSLDDIEHINTNMWIEVIAKIDRFLALIFALMLLVFPLVVILAFYIASR